jgi:hypothetical protein
MPTIQLTTATWVLPSIVTDPRGNPISVFRPQLRCLVRLPGAILPQDGVIDTGAPHTCLPERLWSGLREGTDFEWLSFPQGARQPTGVIGGWRYTYQLARFLVPISLMDYTTVIDRPDVIAAFATGNPPSAQTQQSLPPIIIGLWGGLLEGGKVGIERDPSSGRVNGELAFP